MAWPGGGTEGLGGDAKLRGRKPPDEKLAVNDRAANLNINSAKCVAIIPQFYT